MELSNLDPTVLAIAVAVVSVSIVSMSILKMRRHGLSADTPYSTLDKVLWWLGAPLFALGGFMGAGLFVQSLKSFRTTREGDGDLTPDVDPTKEPTETRSEQVVRIIEEQADEVEEHILHDATDDEVGARGASLFALGGSDEKSDEPAAVEES